MDMTSIGQKLFGKNALMVHQMHRDAVVEVPPNIDVIASSCSCKVQMMFQPGRVLTIQGHPEFDSRISKSWLDQRYKEGLVGQELYGLLILCLHAFNRQRFGQTAAFLKPIPSKTPSRNLNLRDFILCFCRHSKPQELQECLKGGILLQRLLAGIRDGPSLVAGHAEARRSNAMNNNLFAADVEEESRLTRGESESGSQEAGIRSSEEEADNSSQVIVSNLSTGDLCHYSPSPPNIPAACSLTLGLQEREAIQYFRTTFSRHQHTKNPQYNVISVIYNIATKSELAMHMAVSVARREMLCLQNNGQTDVKDDDISILHYSAALSQLAEFVNGADAVTGLDTILASIWLMLTYEQKFGDGNGVGLSSHLKGLATIVQSEARQALTLPADSNHHIPSSANTMELDSSQRRMHTLSLFSARMLIWISLLDAGAASTGLGGDFNASLHSLLEEHAHICDGCDSRLQTSLFRSFTEVAKYSNPLFCRVWGDDYPIQELMDDISNHDIFLLYGSCFQVRYMASRLDSLRKQVSTAAEQCEDVIELAFQEIAETYTETFLLARKITVETDNSLRVIKNLRFIVPHYHAAILYYVRCADPRRSSPDRRMASLKMIMKLAYQAFKLEGDEAMLRIAWPLFIAILETDDLLHREWLIARLRALGKFGKNYSRAAAFVESFVAEEERKGERLDFQAYLTSGGFEQFSI
ncbi:hypothetical protein J3E68DRAFT_430214 [Trichoderma sp. SZMC 28012]